jgi:hypothetical protein
MIHILTILRLSIQFILSVSIIFNYGIKSRKLKEIIVDLFSKKPFSILILHIIGIYFNSLLFMQLNTLLFCWIFKELSQSS